MINVEDVVKKYQNCKDRDELVRQIKEYKSLALQHAGNMLQAGKFNMVAYKLQELCDKLPPPVIKTQNKSSYTVPVKTADISNEENKKINAEWEQKAGGKRGK